MSHLSTAPDSQAASSSDSFPHAPTDSGYVLDLAETCPKKLIRRGCEPYLEGWGYKTSRFFGTERHRWLVLFPNGILQSFDREMNSDGAVLTETLRITNIEDPPRKELNLRQLHLCIDDARIVTISFETLKEAQRWQRGVQDVVHIHEKRWHPVTPVTRNTCGSFCNCKKIMQRLFMRGSVHPPVLKQELRIFYAQKKLKY